MTRAGPGARAAWRNRATSLGVVAAFLAGTHAGIPDGVLVEDRLQRLGTELPDWQDAHARPVVYGFFAC